MEEQKNDRQMDDLVDLPERHREVAAANHAEDPNPRNADEREKRQFDERLGGSDPARAIDARSRSLAVPGDE